jgi:transposase
MERLPDQARWVSHCMLGELDSLSAQIAQFEQRLKALIRVTPEMQSLMSLPGVGVILAATMALEIGDIGRVPSAEHLASYAGTTPRVHASGDHTRYGRTRPDVNRTLKWALAEAGNSVALNHTRFPERHVSQLYRRVCEPKGYPKAIGAVARHLAEATFYLLSQQRFYQDPALVAGRIREV